MTQSVGLAEPVILALAEKKQLHLTPRPINPALRAFRDVTAVALHFQMVVPNRAALLRRIADRLE
ncbi:MAG TPA: hypothetical protein VKC66_06910 [Xanthobacteraceae bacterium]|nr:hypothetical protein [Xanthobacteraceae bacterium]